MYSLLQASQIISCNANVLVVIVIIKSATLSSICNAFLLIISSILVNIKQGVDIIYFETIRERSTFGFPIDSSDKYHKSKVKIVEYE